MRRIDALRKKYPHIATEKTLYAVDEKNFRRQVEKQTDSKIEGGAIGVIWLSNERFILSKRTYLHQGWSLPGGRIEQGEDFEAGFLREIKEETDVEARIIRVVSIDHNTFESPTGDQISLDLVVFEAEAHPIDQNPVTTPDAEQEGLTVQTFTADTIPENMVLRDGERLRAIIKERTMQESNR